MTAPLDEKGHDPKLVAALRALVKRLEATPEELRGPFLVKGLKPYLAPPALPSSSMEVVAWECTDLIMGGEPGVITDVDHAAMRKLQPNAWSVEELVRRSQAHSTIAALRAERDEAVDRAKVWEHYWQHEVKVKGEVISWCKDYQAKLETAEAEVKRLTEDNEALRAAIAEIADFDPDGPIDPDTVRLIRIAGAARRAILTQENADGQ